MSSNYYRQIIRKRRMAGLCLLALSSHKHKKKVWVKKLFVDRVNYCDAKMLNNIDNEDYKNYLRMDNSAFTFLLERVVPLISKQNTLMRECVPAEQRLIATLRFLATGRSYEDLKFSCKISPQLLGKVIPETCKVIYQVLRHEYMKLPTTQEEWKSVSDDFASKWNFPHAIGAMDGKHVRIEKPGGSGSEYFNYKKIFSVVMFAVVNANYEVMYIHTGTNGRISDSTVMRHTKFYSMLTQRQLDIPPPSTLPNSIKETPFVFLGDSAFPISTEIMKPYPHDRATRDHTIFNYRLSRARRVVENGFGIMASRFRFYHTTLNMSLDSVDAVLLASCVLHNFLLRSSVGYMSHQSLIRENIDDWIIVPGEFTNDILTPLEVRPQPSVASGHAVREAFKNYFLNEGSIDFQEHMINVHRG